jgi:hypothetical protein
MARYARQDDAERCTEFIGIWVTPTQRAELDAASRQQATTRSQFARELLFQRTAAVVAATRRSPEAKGLMRELQHNAEELSRTGNNLNQMALRANTAGQVPEREMRWGLLEDYRQVMETIKRAVARVLDL